MKFLRRTFLSWIPAAFFYRIFGRTQAPDRAQGQLPQSGVGPQSQAVRSVSVESLRATPYDSIEKAASATKAGDAESVRAVVEAVFNFRHTFPLPKIMAGALKQRLLDAEIAYLNGKTTGVEESSMVEAMNALATAFETPDYARVSLLQVQLVRANLTFFMPTFMHAAPQPEIGEANPPMSPLQSMMVISSLIGRKVFMPDYQLPPDKWDRDAYPRLLEEERARQEWRRRLVEAEPGTQAQVQVQVTAQLRAMPLDLLNLVRQRIAAMSIADGLKLFNETFVRLGIK